MQWWQRVLVIFRSTWFLGFIGGVMKKFCFSILLLLLLRNILGYMAIVIALISLLATPIAWAGFEEGLAAYKKGNYAEALREIMPLAKKGNALAQYNLGFMYDQGKGVPQDYQEAVMWYRKAAEQGQAGAQFSLGLMYDQGQGVPQDYQEAVIWYRKAAEQGHDDAQFNLGLMYAQGHGVIQDYPEAVMWYRRAAEQGNASAQYNLGTMYVNGQGTSKDYVRAHMWVNLAASRGDNLAQEARDVIAKSMTPSQISDAQLLARDCEKKKYKKCD